MHSQIPYSQIIISGRSFVRFYDRSSTYFGDYHHVRLDARCEIELPDGSNSTVAYSRLLEKMAVPSAVLEEAKMALIEDFRKNSLPYLTAPDFPVKMISKNVPAKTVVPRKYSPGSV